MKKKEKRQSVLNRFEKIGVIIIALILAILNYTYADNIYKRLFEMNPLLVFALIIVFTCVSFLIFAFAHEIGHIVFGLLCGFKFISFRLGNIMLLKKNGRLTITKDSIPGTLGDCRMSPPELVDGKMPVFWYFAGGVTFNLIFALIFSIPIILRLDNPVFAMFCIVAILVNLLYAMLNLSPTATSLPSDGYHIKEIMDDKENVRFIWLSMKILEESHKGIRLSEMPDEWFEISDGDAVDSLTFINYLATVCERMCLQRRYDEAISVIDYAFNSNCKPIGLTELSLAITRFHIAALEGDLEKAKNLFEQHMVKYDKMMKNDASYARVKYGYKLICKPTCSCAEKQKKHFLAMIEKMQKSVYSFMILDEQTLLDEMETAIKNTQATLNT